jgi:hypothetical protein
MKEAPMAYFPLVSLVYSKKDDTFRALSLLELIIVGTTLMFSIAYGMALAGVPNIVAFAVKGFLPVLLIAMYFREGVFHKK